MTRAPLAIAVGALVSARPGAVQPQGIDRVSWMRGCWEQVSGDAAR